MRKTSILLPAVAFALTSACGIPQSEECAKFLECEADFNAFVGLAAESSDQYGEEGSCWDGDEEDAQRCTDECDTLTDLYKNSLEASGAEQGACG